MKIPEKNPYQVHHTSWWQPKSEKITKDFSHLNTWPKKIKLWIKKRFKCTDNMKLSLIIYYGTADVVFFALRFKTLLYLKLSIGHLFIWCLLKPLRGWSGLLEGSNIFLGKFKRFKNKIERFKGPKKYSKWVPSQKNDQPLRNLVTILKLDWMCVI